MSPSCSLLKARRVNDRDVSSRTRMGRKRAGRILVVVAIVATIGCDRVTKHAAGALLAGQSGHSYLADTVRLGYAENPGGFLSLGANWPSGVRTTFFTVATGIGLLALAVMAMSRKRDDWSAVGLAFLVAGGLSNWIDRVIRGSVVDFLNVGIGPVRTGIFNVADVAIMLGVAILLIAELRKSRQSDPV